MDLNSLWMSLNPNIGLSEMKTSVEKIITHHTATDLFTLIENQKQMPMETVMMKLQCLLYHADTASMTKWLDTEEATLKSQVPCLIQRIVRYGAVPEFKGREDIGFNAEDFAGISTKAHVSLKVLQALMDILQNAAKETEDAKQEVYHDLIEALIDKSIILVLEHMDEADLWTSKSCVECANHLLQNIVKYRKKASFAALLCDDHNTEPGYFHTVAKTLLPKLSKSSWKENPAACKAFSSCLFEIKFPNTSMFLDQLLPPALLISDDHQLDYKILGTKCLHHIIQNTSASELSWFNRIDVIYSSLQRLMYTHEPELQAVVLPCMLDLLKVFQKLQTTKEGSVRPITKQNEIFLRLLTDMHLENNLVPRRIYSQFLPQYIELLGIEIVWHFKKFFTVIAAFLEISDGKYEKSRLDMLDVLKCVIEIAWPRIGSKCKDILLLLVPLAYELAANRGVWAEGVKDKLFGKCEEVIVLLNKVDHEKMSAMLGELTSVQTSPDCDVVLKRWQDLCAM